MAIDLTRFDFHAVRFMYSEDVKMMSAKEVGQYILLLCEAWLSGKDTSLPDNMEYLSSLVRGEAVSENVLKKFPLVETQWGTRRRNEPLYREWCTTIERHKTFSENGRQGGVSVSPAKSEASRQNGMLGGRPSKNLSETQANNFDNLTQTKSSQAKPNQSESVQTNPNQSNFRNIAIKYRAAMGKSHSKSAEFRDQYSQFCARYGEDVILKDFEDWVGANEWRSDKLGNRGLYWYFKDLPDRIEELNAVEVLKPKETTVSESEVERINREGNEQARLEAEKRAAKIREDEAAAEELKAHPFEC